MGVVVIGGGIVGCHIAYRLASAKMEVFLLEKEKALGEHTSTRNSGAVRNESARRWSSPTDRSIRSKPIKFISVKARDKRVR